MGSVLWAGVLIGAVLGLAHGAYLYRCMTVVGRGSIVSAGRRRARALYYAVAAFILWVLLGTYVLILWLLALIPHGVKRLIRP
jgi:hypothetical protein